jgi:allantoate deiminase
MAVSVLTGQAIQHRIDALAAISEDCNALTRLFLSREHRRANELVANWMRAAGMRVRTDAIGNIVGRYEGESAGAPALLLGSHLDTVRDAGRYDGMLGVVIAIACVETLHRTGRRFPFAIEIIGFGDEEGVRFGAAMLGSRAVAGTFATDLLALRDEQGLTLADALQAFGLDPDHVGDAARLPGDFLAYVELHIEQGPVLEASNLPIGCVTAIAGASRLSVEVTGRAGHAGTVPMAARADALAAAAACITAVENRCAREAGLVGTVGMISVSPGAINVIPGAARFTVDVRSPDDRQRQAAIANIEETFAAIAQSRDVTIASRIIHELPSVACAGWLQDQIRAAVASEAIAPLDLASGAGHDGMAMARIADIAMIFVRCSGGISHHPAEAVSLDDIAAGACVLMRFIENFEPRQVE